MEAKAGTEAAYEIDERMACWRQGDLALGERWFVHVGLEAQSSAPAVLTTEVAGLMVVSQTCDLVRRHGLRPCVEFAPLIALDPEIWESVWRGERPSMATLSCLRAFGLAADLDRAMTVEKRIVADWVRTEGCMNETEVRLLADELARHRQRFAFPDEFSLAARKFIGTIKHKHGRASPTGTFLSALREIRIQALPGWGAASIALRVWFILESPPPNEQRRGFYFEAERLLGKLDVQGGVFGAVEPPQLVLLSEMTAEEYVCSERLDVEYLSATGSM